MANNEIQPQKVRPLAARLIFAALKILQENGGEMRGRQVVEAVEKRVQLGEWDKQRSKGQRGQTVALPIFAFFTRPLSSTLSPLGGERGVRQRALLVGDDRSEERRVGK